MSKNMKKHILSVCALMFCGTYLFAQSELPELAPDEAKVAKKIKYDFPHEGRKGTKGGGYSVSLELLKTPPKKVALVSFYTFDPGCTKQYNYSADNGIVTTTTYVKKSLSSKGNAGTIAMGMFTAGIDNMITKFKSYGMDLLLPEQFLDSPEKTEYYNKFEADHGGAANWLMNVGVDKKNDTYGYLEGWNVINIVAEPQANYQQSGMLKTMGYSNKVMDSQIFFYNKDTRMMNTVGYELAKHLGVDAVVIVYATIYVPKEKRIMLQNVNMTMFGPNPIQPGENDKKPMFYNHGVFYCGVRYQPDCAILDIDKKKPETQKLDFKGFNEVLGALSTKMGDYLTGKDD